MNLRQSIKSLSLLASPIIIGQLGQMLIGAGDVYVASLYSTNSVASIGVANGVINPIFLFGIGLTMGISPSLAFERGQEGKITASLRTIISYSFFWGLIITLACLLLNFLVPFLGFDPVMVPSIQKYINIVSWSFPLALVFQGIKEFLQAHEEVFFPNLLSIIAVVFNLITNYILVFGFASFEGYGETGLAIASVITRVFLCLGILVYVLRVRPLGTFSLDLYKKIFSFSFPIAIMFFVEVLAFCSVTILSGTIGIIAAAANNIIMTLASIAFMIPLSLASAVAVKIGHAYGEKDIETIRAFSLASICMTAIFILFSATSFFLFPELIMRFISSDQAVITLGVQLLFIVAIFQISDATQVVLGGILRGLKFTKITSLMVLVGYWGLGIPIGYFLAFHSGFGAEGLWIGLACALSFCAVFLAVFTYRKLTNVDFNFSPGYN